MVKEKQNNESEDSNEIKVEIKSSKKQEESQPDNEESVEIENEMDLNNSKPGSGSNSESAVEDSEKKIGELEDRILRLSAEFDNYKKRTARQYEEMIRLSNINIISQLLDVIDNFERALEAVGKTDDKEALKKGAEMIYQQLLEILKKENVVHIIAIGEPFDPNFHEAMMQAESDEYPEGIVISEMVKGYKLKDKVIRYSKVVVSNGQSNSEESDED